MPAWRPPSLSHNPQLGSAPYAARPLGGREAGILVASPAGDRHCMGKVSEHAQPGPHSPRGDAGGEAGAAELGREKRGRPPSSTAAGARGARMWAWARNGTRVHPDEAHTRARRSGCPRRPDNVTLGEGSTVDGQVWVTGNALPSIPGQVPFPAQMSHYACLQTLCGHLRRCLGDVVGLS